MSTLHLYRSLLRELRLASKQPRRIRNPVVQQHLRELIQEQRPDMVEKMLSETRDFLRASRIHAELLKRYNPLHDMTEEEKIRATARRVGLNTPKEYIEE
ncbi:hypothetical protein M231_03826 [Tremella mesenterica]|uniref:Complex 1 LYR protein n=1 Tax=Tremella mesenterica TaxID=5217 RepID=A0A4V1M424_TREME|nr:uncharacterized protein TREMEDRAFT_36587 [Tremella mesenterica DSM 1558]EIW72322.1 hypothetical protein TREMEDRAFT_36587 [Tremella mesenterica DSM 1558]RXK38877.1 hypothetical protein M231_03826 [Tremella mesenterica]